MNGFLEYLANNIDNDDVVKDINNIAIDIVEDYANIPSEESGSVIFVHQESPLLDNESTELSESISIGIHHTKGEENE